MASLLNKFFQPILISKAVISKARPKFSASSKSETFENLRKG